MRVKLDENMPLDLRDELIAQGHDADTCGDEGLLGATDPDVLAAATADGRMLITFDLDFGDVLRFPPGAHAGIVVLRLRRQDYDSCIAAVARFMFHVPADQVAGSLIVVGNRRVRVYRAPPP